MSDLGAADRGLLARERALSPAALACLLDAGLLRARLTAAGVRARRVEIAYLRYKPRTSAVAGVRIETAGGALWAQAVAYPVGVHRKLDRVQRVALERGGALLFAPAVGLAVVSASADRALPGIPAALERHPAAETLVYKPGRRWVARCRDCRAIVKAHAPGRAAAAVEAHRAVEHALPTAPIVRAGDDGVIETRLLEGRPLTELEGDARAEAELRVGVALARLHAAPPSSAPADEGAPAPGPHGGGGGRDPEPGLEDAVRGVAALLPDLAGIARDAAGEVAAAVAALDRVDPVPSHGDCSADQVVVAPDGRVRLIDLDRAGPAAPMSDPGAWAAAALAAGEPPERAGRALVAGYRRGGGEADEAALLAHTAAALLRRAAEPFRSRCADWDARVRALLDEARRLAALSRVRSDAALPGAPLAAALPGARVISHRPGRRAVLRVPEPAGAAGPEFVKLLRARRFADVADRAARVQGLRVLRAPRVVARDERAAMLGLSSAGGRTLLEAGADPELPDDALEAAWRRVGRGLAELHALPSGGLPAHGVADEIDATRRALAAASACGALEGARAEAALEAVARLLEAAPAAPVLGVLHRDLHDKQLLVPAAAFTAADVDRGRVEVGVIDVDTLAVGERALDLANLLVHLELRAAQGALTAGRAAAAAAALREGAGEDAAWARVPAYAASARLRLAGVYAQRPGGLPAARALLGAAAVPAAGR